MKKFMKGLIAAGLTFAMITPVFAEDPSPVKVGNVTINQIGDKPAPEGTKVVADKDVNVAFKDETANNQTPDEVKNAINTSKSVTEIIQAVAEAKGSSAPAVSTEGGKTTMTTTDGTTTVDTSKVKLLTDFIDLSVRNEVTGEKIDVNGPITVTMEVTGLTKDVEVFVLHYSTKRQVLELIKPSKIDYENKCITVTFPDLSPVAIVYVPVADKGSIVTKPSLDTEVNAVVEKVTNNSLFYFAGAAVVVAVVGAVVLKKRNQE